MTWTILYQMQQKAMYLLFRYLLDDRVWICQVEPSPTHFLCLRSLALPWHLGKEFGMGISILCIERKKQNEMLSILLNTETEGKHKRSEIAE